MDLGARSMRREEKLFFGPLMTKERFGQIWCTQLRDFVHQYIEPGLDNPHGRFTPLWMALIADAGSDYMLAFVGQARDHSFSPDDFDPHRKAKTDPFRTIRLADYDPFDSIMVVTHMVDSFRHQLKQMKSGKMVYGRVWRDLPRADRKDINDMLAWFEEGVEHGWWVEHPQDDRRVTMRAIGLEWMELV